MFERIPVRKEEKYINVNLWIGTETLKNYRGYSLTQLKSHLYNQVMKAMNNDEMCVTILRIKPSEYVENESIRLHNHNTISDLRDLIENVINIIEAHGVEQ